MKVRWVVLVVLLSMATAANSAEAELLNFQKEVKSTEVVQSVFEERQPHPTNMQKKKHKREMNEMTAVAVPVFVTDDDDARSEKRTAGIIAAIIGVVLLVVLIALILHMKEPKKGKRPIIWFCGIVIFAVLAGGGVVGIMIAGRNKNQEMLLHKCTCVSAQYIVGEVHAEEVVRPHCTSIARIVDLDPPKDMGLFRPGDGTVSLGDANHARINSMCSGCTSTTEQWDCYLRRDGAVLRIQGDGNKKITIAFYICVGILFLGAFCVCLLLIGMGG